ncbi:hypothetical protein Trydic_g16912 [Trypoxylus dichotomus]
MSTSLEIITNFSTNVHAQAIKSFDKTAVVKKHLFDIVEGEARPSSFLHPLSAARMLFTCFLPKGVCVDLPPHVYYPYKRARKQAKRFSILPNPTLSNPTYSLVYPIRNNRSSISSSAKEYKNLKMAVSESAMIFMSIDSPEKRSVSPMTPSPSRGIKGIRLFRAISKKLARRSQEDLGEDDSRSSSTDSCSSTSISRCSRSRKLKHHVISSEEGDFRSVSTHHLSSSSVSDTGSSLQVACSKHRHSSADSIRKVFQNLTIRSRSKSCNTTNNKENKKSKKNPPKRILRPPVRYIYMKGWSGLPTQRIPITISRSYVNNPCGYSMHYMTGLNR